MPGAPTPLVRAAIGLLATVVMVVGAFSLGRPGYSVDEEFTVFAVRGIQQHGLPLLPSSLLYDRGLAYSYASWLAGAVTGVELPAYRALSLISAALIVVLCFILVRRVAHSNAAIAASLLVASSIPFWATATTARFYAPFLAVSLALLLVFSTLRTSCTLRALCTVAALSALARWTHELAFLLAAVPTVCWLLARGDRRRWFYGAIAMAAGLLGAQAVLFVLHALAPSSGDTMVRRFFLWQVLNLFEQPGHRQFTIPIVVMVIGWIIVPRHRWWVSVSALSIAAMILTFSIAQASNAAPLSRALVQSVVFEGSRYPLDMFWHIARATPFTLLLAVAMLVYRARQAASPVPRRAAHALWIGWVLWFGVIESGITTNYLLLPMSFMLIAIAIDLPAIPLVAAVLSAVVIADQWRGGSLERARPTIAAEGMAEIRAGLQPNDRVVCTDELGCLMLAGRIDRWLALDDFVRERFVVQRGSRPTGVYTGVPAVFRPSEVFEPNADGTLPDRTIVIDVFKDYPIGNSRSWLPRALEESGLTVTPLLETPQLRVLQISPPEQHVRLR